MSAFKDSKNREWTLVIHYPMRQKVLKETGVDLFKIDGTLQQDLADPDKMFPVLWSMCSAQAAALNPVVSEDDFFQSFVADTIPASRDALAEAIEDFTPSQQRKPLQLARKKTADMMAVATRKSMERLEKMDVEKMVDEAMAKAEAAAKDPISPSNDTSSSSPGASGSPDPATSLSVN